MIRGGPNGETARTLMDFLLSEQLERLLVETDSHNSPIHPTVAGDHPQYAISNPLPVDYGHVADYLPMAIESAKEILR